MNTNLIPFQFEGHELRVVQFQGKTLFCARDVATTLAYADPAQAYKAHCKSLILLSYVNLTELKWPNPNPRGAYFIPEPDVYRLIVKSAKPEAERFEKWVFEEVLPTIRQQGSYEITQYAHARARTIYEDAADRLEQELRVGQLLEAPLHIVQQESVKLVCRETGVDFSHHLTYAKAQQVIKQEEVMKEPTELASELGFRNATAVNKWLAEHNLQVKVGKEWKPTDDGQKYCVIHSWTKKGKEGYNLKWNVNSLKNIKETV